MLDRRVHRTASQVTNEQTERRHPAVLGSLGSKSPRARSTLLPTRSTAVRVSRSEPRTCRRRRSGLSVSMSSRQRVRVALRRSQSARVSRRASSSGGELKFGGGNGDGGFGRGNSERAAVEIASASSRNSPQCLHLTAALRISSAQNGHRFVSSTFTKHALARNRSGLSAARHIARRSPRSTVHAVWPTETAFAPSNAADYACIVARGEPQPKPSGVARAFRPRRWPRGAL